MSWSAAAHRFFHRGVSDDERGEATIEFLGMMVLVGVPVFYLIVTLGLVQSAVYASESAAREGARLVANHPDNVGVLDLQATVVFSDFGLEGAPHVEVSCEPVSCASSNAVVRAVVRSEVPLPFLPEWLGAALRIPVQAEAQMPRSGVSLR